MNRAGISLTTNGEDACSDDEEEDDDDGRGAAAARGKSRVAIAQFTPRKVDTL